MLPKWHILLGAIFSLVLYFSYPQIPILFILLVFLSSFLIDIDHYLQSVVQTGKLGVMSAYKHHLIKGKKEAMEIKKGRRERGDFHLFHTIEFHIFVFALGFLWPGFFFIFLGMFFHSVLDVISLTYSDRLFRREYLLINWIKRKIFK